jgi:hypothetical protein
MSIKFSISSDLILDLVFSFTRGKDLDKIKLH